MIQSSDDNTADTMTAEPDDPRLTVHGLSEFTYCPRAGLCLYEQDYANVEPEPEADLSFLPIHEPRELALVLETLMRQFMWALVGGLGAFVILAVVAWYVGWISAWIAPLAVLLVTIWGLYDRGYWVYVAQCQLELWQQAVPGMPDADSPKVQDVDWRNLISSGAAVIRPPAPYNDAGWKLGGKPWRVLEYGDLRIPVFKHRTPWKDLYHQHFVRMVAYCHLLETSEGVRSPYGVIVKGETFAAVTVPNTLRTQAMFCEALRSARQTVRESEEIRRRPPPPDNEGTCRQCHLGWPVRLRPGEHYLSQGQPLEPNVALDSARRPFHSHCGDRFQWIPPHRQAMGLIEA